MERQTVWIIVGAIVVVGAVYLYTQSQTSIGPGAAAQNSILGGPSTAQLIGQGEQLASRALGLISSSVSSSNSQPQTGASPQ